MDSSIIINILENSSNKIIPIINEVCDIEQIKFDAPLVEYVYRKSNSQISIIELVKSKGNMISVGTILNVYDAEFCIKHGIKILFSPHFDKQIMDYCYCNKVLLIPGVFTSTEIMNAYNMGVKVMKFFPCHSQDNINMLKQYSNVYDRLGIKFIATGGVNISNYKEILSIKNVIGVGSSSIKDI